MLQEALKYWSKPSRASILLVLWLSILRISGLYLFTRGFLLSRLSLTTANECDVTQTSFLSSSSSYSSCTLPATHKRLVLLIIDALRFDFISPHPPVPQDEMHHGVLTLPAELTAMHPDRSWIFNAYSDPPTATMQRIKGLTTGSLPTFVDISSNFGGLAVEEDSILAQLKRHGKKVAFMGDDTWMNVYPDMFEPTFPYDSFNVEDLHTVDNGVITHLFPLLRDNYGKQTRQRKSESKDSEDSGWDVLIGHFLGVDHAAHRVGPSHPTMRAKLIQMNQVLNDVVELLDEDTLLVVLGDHGMDAKGDHGGDEVLETSAATWIYSKTPFNHPFSASNSAAAAIKSTSIPTSLIPNTTFPNEPESHRRIQQIDLVPTLSLLLGIPIPFNNLGIVVPELFANPTGANSLEAALSINARQVKAYLDEYRASASGSELDPYWNEIESSWTRISDAFKKQKDNARQVTPKAESEAAFTASIAAFTFTRNALETCRALWAQFSSTLILMGLVVTALTIPVTADSISMLDLDSEQKPPQHPTGQGQGQGQWEVLVASRIFQSVMVAAGGGLVGAALYYPLGRLGEMPLNAFQLAVFSFAISGTTALLFSSLHVRGWKYNLRTWIDSIITVPGVLLLLQAIILFSNSFILWEERVILFLLISSITPSLYTLISTFGSPSTSTKWNLQRRTLLFGSAFIICARLISLSTVCREEQGSQCTVTFYTSSVFPSPPYAVRLLIIPTAILLPRVIRGFMKIAAADHGYAPLFTEVFFRAALIAGTTFWLLDWLEGISTTSSTDSASGSNYIDINWTAKWVMKYVNVREVRTILGQSIMLVSAGGMALWSVAPINLSVKRQAEPDGSATVQVLGFANSFGSVYLSLLLFVFSFVWVSLQLTGQIILALAFVALMCYLEFLDSIRDLRHLTPSNQRQKATSTSNANAGSVRSYTSPTLQEIQPLVLLALQVYYATGHEATLNSLQWKSAFVLSGERSFLSPLTVTLNTIGPVFFLVFSIPLLALWAVEPFNRTANLNFQRKKVLGGALRSILVTSNYFAVVFLASAASSAVLRRHLMVWKVFAPRYMLAALCVLAVDVAGILSLFTGVNQVLASVAATFQGVGG